MCINNIQDLNPIQNYAGRYLLYQHIYIVSADILHPLINQNMVYHTTFTFQVGSAYSCTYTAEHIMMTRSQGVIEF